MGINFLICKMKIIVTSTSAVGARITLSNDNVLTQCLTQQMLSTANLIKDTGGDHLPPPPALAESSKLNTGFGP